MSPEAVLAGVAVACQVFFLFFVLKLALLMNSEGLAEGLGEKFYLHLYFVLTFLSYCDHKQ